jgi:soluble lytic murein transglycosylase-like protein
MMITVALGLNAATVPEPVLRASVVRADARSGRLVRSVVVRPPVLEPRAISPADANASLPSASAEPAANVREMARQIASRHEVEPLLVDSMIRVESNYNPYAVSHKGAEGLMQLVPGTARRFGVTNTFNPAQNIEGGVRYLKHLLSLYGGDQRLALAAYNAGEGAVARHKGMPPYPETRNYVSQVDKRLGQLRGQETREAEKTDTTSGVGAEPEYPRIEKIVDAEGREYYRAR